MILGKAEKTKKRSDYISWDTYFFMLAFTAAQRSKDPSTVNGACIVDPVLLSPISLGYNGFPRGCNDDLFPWDNIKPDPYDNKYVYVEHAERNAIFNAARRGVSTDGSIIYIYSARGLWPCSDCTKAIIQSGIIEVKMMFTDDNPDGRWDFRASKRMLEAAGVFVSTPANLNNTASNNSWQILQDVENMIVAMERMKESFKKFNV